MKNLGADEIEALYGRPRFTHDERVHYFSLSPPEKAELQQLHTIKSRIYFILQLGYFEDDLVDDQQWQQKETLLTNTGLTIPKQPIEDHLASLEQQLEDRLAAVNQRILSGKNEHFQIKTGGQRRLRHSVTLARGCYPSYLVRASGPSWDWRTWLRASLLHRTVPFHL